MRGRSGFQRVPEGEYVDGGVGKDGASSSSTGPSETHAPEENASFWSRRFFFYASGLMKLGYAKHLQPEDLWPTAQGDAAHVESKRFARCLEQAKMDGRGNWWLFWAYKRAHGRPFFLSGILKLLQDCAQFTGPVLLNLILDFLSKPYSNRWKGYLLALSLFFTAAIQTLSVNWYFHILYRIGMHVKIGTVSAIFDKSLKISNTARNRFGTGSIINLQSNDAQKLWELPQYVHMIWSGPFQILITFFLLVRVIRLIPALAGLGVMLCLFPLNAFLGKKLSASRKRLITKTDARVKMVSEVIMGIKAIKLYAWEDPYISRISQLRSQELVEIKTTVLLNLFQTLLFMIIPVLVSMVSFIVFAALGYELTSSVAFTALSLFNLLRFPIMMLPKQIMSLIQAKVSLARVQEYLEAEEISSTFLPPPDTNGALRICASINDGTFSWDLNSSPVLRDVTFHLKAGELVVVVGEVGSGKSSFLCSLLGETHRLNGSVQIKGSVGYTIQDPWIQNDTVKGNILMGLDCDERFYHRVIKACALESDISVLAAGDATEIGEKGVNLSGGQRHRVALARAAYAQAGIYLLDDPLSAVDTHVGQHLWRECICGVLKDSARVVVTHQLQYVRSADRIVYFKDGKIEFDGTYKEMKQMGLNLDGISEEDHVEEDGEIEPVHVEEESMEEEADGLDTPYVEDPNSLELITQAKEAEFAQETAKGTSSPKKEDSGKLVKVEERAQGSVSKSVYIGYLRAWGPYFILPTLLMVGFFCERGLLALQNYWLAVWSEATVVDHTWSVVRFYLMVYVLLALTALTFTFFRALTLVYGSINAAKNLQNSLLSRVCRLSMSFFDSQPTGRLLNRFTNDTEAVDLQIAPTLNMALNCVITSVTNVISICFVTPLVIFAIVPLYWLYTRVQQYYIRTSRELKRLDAISRSPIFSLFSETLNGIFTIRAFRKQADFKSKNNRLLDASNRAYWPIMTVNRWLSVRLELLGAAVVLGAALMTVFTHSSGSEKAAGLAGFSLTSAIALTGLMAWMVRQVTDLEVGMNCVERVLEYSAIEPEAPPIIESNRPPPGWPHSGAIQVKDLWVRYRPDLDPVIKGISFEVKGMEKIGVCGRTGCGKSTLMMTLYRIVEPSDGGVLIDGIDSQSIGLFDLRSRLSLVPQDPVIFSGSIRSNLDPFNQYPDERIWEALRKCSMHSLVSSSGKGLEMEVAESGQNLSVGQRQLLCLGRALLRQSKILVLDEATSNVDSTTDNLIQKTIREAFADCTMLVIAHRLNTIIDADRILVMDQGKIAEFDTPAALLADEESMFSKLVGETLPGMSASLKKNASSKAISNGKDQ